MGFLGVCLVFFSYLQNNINFVCLVSLNVCSIETIALKCLVFLLSCSTGSFQEKNTSLFF